MAESTVSPSTPTVPPRRWPLLPLLAVLLLVGLALFGQRGIMKARLYAQQKATLEAELREVEAHNAALRKEIEALRSDRRYIETIARRELGMVKPDEIIYQFPASGEKPTTVAHSAAAARH